MDWWAECYGGAETGQAAAGAVDPYTQAIKTGGDLAWMFYGGPEKAERTARYQRDAALAQVEAARLAVEAAREERQALAMLGAGGAGGVQSMGVGGALGGVPAWQWGLLAAGVLLVVGWK